MTLSSICIRDVAAYSLLRSASLMLPEFNKLLLLSSTIKAVSQIRAGNEIFVRLVSPNTHPSFCNGAHSPVHSW